MSYLKRSVLILVYAALGAGAGDFHGQPPNQLLTALSSYEDRAVAKWQIYAANSRGLALYDEGKFAQAYPHLLTAAQRGFKRAQAQVGYMHLNGLGGAERNSRIGIGWLGVAASGSTDPEIKEYFDKKWRQVPKEYLRDFDKIVDAFEANYGAARHGVACRRERGTGTTVKTLACRFDEPLSADVLENPYSTIEAPLPMPPYRTEVPSAFLGD